MEKRPWTQSYSKNEERNPKRLKATNPRIDTVRDLHVLLAFHQDLEELRNGLSQFKQLLESIVYPQEGDTKISRNLDILKEYLDSQKPRDETEEGLYVQHIIQTWQFADYKNDDNLVSASTSILALLLKTLSTRIDLKDHGIGICRTILLPEQAKLVSKGLSAVRTKAHIISPCTRLLTEIVSFDGGVMGRQLYSRRDQLFDPKIISRNLGLANKQPEDPEEARRRPSVRSNTIRYLLANLQLQQEGIVMDIIKQGNITKSLFEGLYQDSTQLIADVLSVIESSVLDNQNIPWTNKTFMFGERNLGLLSQAYRTDFPETPVGDSKKPIAEIFQDFMFKLVTSSNAGVLRHCSGWYIPEDKDAVEEYEESEIFDTDLLDIYGQNLRRPPIRNTALAELAQSLKPYSDERERLLLLEIFKAAPELVADYWFRRINFTYEPKLTATWIGYSSLIFSAISLPIPEYFGRRTGFSSKPPPTSLAIESILPIPLNQQVLTKCILQSSNLIRAFAIRVLIVALQKLKKVLDMYERANAESATGRWNHGRDALISMFVQRAPGMKDVILLFRHHQNDNIMQRESITRLLSLYFEAMPTVAMDEKFDISFALLKSLQKADSLVNTDPESRMELLELGHLLKIARRSVNVSWWKKPESAKYSPFLTVLLLYVKTKDSPSKEVRNLLLSVIRQVGLLQQTTTDSSLEALATSLTDDSEKIVSEGVLTFIDDLLLKFQQRPIVFEDDLDEAIKDSGNQREQIGPVSLWLMALVKQWPFVPKIYQTSVPDIVKWLSRFLGLLKWIGEDETILNLVRQKLEDGVEDIFLKKTLAQIIDVRLQSTNEFDKTFTNGVNGLKINGTDHKTSYEDILSQFQPPSSKPPNFLKFKTGDVQTSLDSPSFASLCICLSAKENPDRIQAVSAIQQLMFRLQSGKSFAEGEMIYLLLGELVETYQEFQGSEGNRLPYLASTFAAHAMPVLLDPTHTMYTKLSAFLTIKPSWHPARLVRYFLENVIGLEPSEETDAAPWKEVDWVLDWLYDGLRTSLDGEVLRKVGAWETLGTLGAHPSLGSSKATGIDTDIKITRLQNRVRGKIIRLIGRAIHVGQAAVLVTGQGGLAWMEMWEQAGWIDEKLSKALKNGMIKMGGDKVENWTGGVLKE